MWKTVDSQQRQDWRRGMLYQAQEKPYMKFLCKFSLDFPIPVNQVNL